MEGCRAGCHGDRMFWAHFSRNHEMEHVICTKCQAELLFALPHDDISGQQTFIQPTSFLVAMIDCRDRFQSKQDLLRFLETQRLT